MLDSTSRKLKNPFSASPGYPSDASDSPPPAARCCIAAGSNVGKRHVAAAPNRSSPRCYSVAPQLWPLPWAARGSVPIGDPIELRPPARPLAALALVPCPATSVARGAAVHSVPLGTEHFVVAPVAAAAAAQAVDVAAAAAVAAGTAVGSPCTVAVGASAARTAAVPVVPETAAAVALLAAPSQAARIGSTWPTKLRWPRPVGSVSSKGN